MSRRKACLVINPRGGANVVKMVDILAVLDAGGYQTNVALKEYGGHTLEIGQHAAEEKCGMIVACGGDGTLNQVVNGVLNADSKSVVGVIPGGTANLWATEISVPTDNAVKAALALLNSETRRVDVGCVTVQDLLVPTEGVPAQDELSAKKQKRALKKKKDQVRQATRPYFLLMAGLGLDAAVMQGVSKPLKYKIKQAAVGLSALKELPAYRPFPIEVRADDGNLLWQGEALQVVIGNTRLYADVLHITPDAYIDDGQLDLCIITAGDPLGTIQQIFSLLTRHKPDNLNTQYFRNSRLILRVPASVGLQLDGSAVKLKDYLNPAQTESLTDAEDPEKIMVEYCFESLPQALRVAVPRTYDNTLFEESEPSPQAEPIELQAVPTSDEQHAQYEPISDEQQQPTDGEQPTLSEVPSASTVKEHIAKLRDEGFQISVVGVNLDARNDTYVIAGTITQQSTNAIKPVAIVIDKKSIIHNHMGEKVAPACIHSLQDGHKIIVTGKKNKRGVIHAQEVVL